MKKPTQLGVGWPCADDFFVWTNATLPSWSQAPIPVTKGHKRVGVGSVHRKGSIPQASKACKAYAASTIDMNADDREMRECCKKNDVDWTKKRGASRRKPLEHYLSTFRAPEAEEEEPLSFTLAPPACTLETCGEPFPWWDRSLRPARSLLDTGQLLQLPQEPFPSYRAFLSSRAWHDLRSFLRGGRQCTPVTDDHRKRGGAGQGVRDAQLKIVSIVIHSVVPTSDRPQGIV